MINLARELCKFATGVVADDNEALFAKLGDEIPLDIFRFRSGDSFNGWMVPQNWRVKQASIVRDGKLVFDGLTHSLAVAKYSKSFKGVVTWEELKPRLTTNQNLPDAYMFHCMWQYRPWAAEWAFSVPYAIYKALGPGDYHINLETEYSPGEMLVAHAIKQGSSPKTIVLNSNTCHPHMANDGFAGTAVLIRLFQWLEKQTTYYNYRLVLGPEHLGSVFYLRGLPRQEVDNMVCGIFEEMPGTSAAIKACSTFSGGHMIDQAFANVLKHNTNAYELVPWRMGAGNDETVWEAPGYEIPFVEVTRCEEQSLPFKEYHSSMDTPELMDTKQLDEMLMVLKKVVFILENNATIQRKFNGLVCLSNPEFNLYMERPDPSVNKNLDEDAEQWGHLLDCLLRYFDGSMTILDIAERHNIPFDKLHHYLQAFAAKGLVELNFAAIERRIPHRV